MPNGDNTGLKIFTFFADITDCLGLRFFWMEKIEIYYII